MTATIKPPDPNEATHRRPRFSSLEILGFSEPTSVWSDSPAARDGDRRGRHRTPPPASDTLVDWEPEEIGGRLNGGDIRWGLVVSAVVLIGSLAGLGFWLYQRPAAQEQASVDNLTTQARALESSMPVLEHFNDDLLVADPSADTSGLFEVEGHARGIFDASGDLRREHTGLRNASSKTAESAIEGIRLAIQSHTYRSAVVPLLVTPELETDPALIELDEAARQFGDWQMTYDEMRTALPERVLPDVTRQLDVLSGDLTSILGRYVDSLRQDDMSAAQGVVSDLGLRLAKVDDVLAVSMGDIQRRVAVQIEEVRVGLDRLLGR